MWDSRSPFCLQLLFSFSVDTAKRPSFSEFLLFSGNPSQIPMVLHFLTTIFTLLGGRVYSRRREVRENWILHELHVVVLPGRTHWAARIPSCWFRHGLTDSWVVCRFLSHTAAQANNNIDILQPGLDCSDSWISANVIQVPYLMSTLQLKVN